MVKNRDPESHRLTLTNRPGPSSEQRPLGRGVSEVEKHFALRHNLSPVVVQHELVHVLDIHVLDNHRSAEDRAISALTLKRFYGRLVRGQQAREHHRVSPTTPGGDFESSASRRSIMNALGRMPSMRRSLRYTSSSPARPSPHRNVCWKEPNETCVDSTPGGSPGPVWLAG